MSEVPQYRGPGLLPLKVAEVAGGTTRSLIFYYYSNYMILIFRLAERVNLFT